MAPAHRQWEQSLVRPISWQASAGGVMPSMRDDVWDALTDDRKDCECSDFSVSNASPEDASQGLSAKSSAAALEETGEPRRDACSPTEVRVLHLPRSTSAAPRITSAARVAAHRESKKVRLHDASHVSNFDTFSEKSLATMPHAKRLLITF